jgi:hypothetical protein
MASGAQDKIPNNIPLIDSYIKRNELQLAVFVAKQKKKVFHIYKSTEKLHPKPLRVR